MDGMIELEKGLGGMCNLGMREEINCGPCGLMKSASSRRRCCKSFVLEHGRLGFIVGTSFICRFILSFKSSLVYRSLEAEFWLRL
jgi:hypothetical protein